MSFDLRKHPHDDVVTRVQAALQTGFDITSRVLKRRSVGFRTERDTWVRIEIRDLARSDGQGWGVEAASVLQDVAMPAWHQGISWLDHGRVVVWRADETDLIVDRPVKPGGVLTIEPELSESWWTTFNDSLTALSSHTTVRTATPHLQPITQARFSSTIKKVFPAVDTTITEWTAAHADLAWANLTAPNCHLLDWEDWGMAPRGWDASTLWSASLAVPTLANRVLKERQVDLDNRTGELVQLYHCAELLGAPAGYVEAALLEPAQRHGAELLTDLQR